MLPSSPSTTHFLTHIGCQVGEAGEERGSSEISHQADNINNSRLSQPASDTLHTSTHYEFRTNFHSNKNHFKFKIRLKFSKLKEIIPFRGISCLSKSVINLETRGGGDRLGSRGQAGERGGDGNCTDNWGLLYKDNTRHVGQPNTFTILKCFSFDLCRCLL